MSDADAFDPEFSESMLRGASDLAGRLAQALAQERDVLARRDLERLHAVVEEKDRLIELLAQMQRSGALAVDAAALDDAEPEVRARIGGLQDALRNQLVRCHEANQINGRLVHRARQSVDEVLATLTGERRQNTYGATGARDGGGASRSFGHA